MKKAFMTFLFTISFLAIFSESCLSDSNYRIKKKIVSAKENVVEDFKANDKESLSKSVSDLVFWTQFLHLKSKKIEPKDTPLDNTINSLSNIDRALTPYELGFFLWAEKVKRTSNIDITPKGLVRGRKFQR